MIKSTFKRRIATPAATLCAVLMLGACVETIQEGAQSAATTVMDWTVPDNIEPLFHSIKDEYCVAPLAAQRFGSGQLKEIAGTLSQLRNHFVSDAMKAKSTYCDQNLGGVVLLTDRSMNRALDKAANALTSASLALDTNISSQNATLARIARMRNLSLGQKLQPEYLEDMQALDEEMARLSEDTVQKLEALAEQGAISPAAQAKLREAHGHFVDFRHYQGKAIAGAAIFESARGIHGNGVIVQAFKEALELDARQARANGQAQPDLDTTENLVTAFVNALPKFVETTFTAGRVSNAIWEAADTGDFEDSLEDFNEPSAETTEEFASYSAEVETSASSLGLPSVQSVT